MGEDPQAAGLSPDLAAEDLARRCRAFLEKRGVWPFVGEGAEERLPGVVELVRSEAESMQELADLVRPFLFDQVSYEAETVRRHLRPEPVKTAKGVRALRAALEEVTEEAWDEERVAAALDEAAVELEVEPGELLGPFRTALTGRLEGPSLFATARVLGREATLTRLDTLFTFLSHDPAVEQARRAAEGIIPSPS